MSKKKLILNESVTRRFMKLATIEPTYVSSFLNEAEEEEMDMAGDDMAGDKMAGEEEMGEEELMEALRGISYVPSQGEVVNEVAKRVARRLQQAKLHEAKLNRALGKRR